MKVGDKVLCIRNYGFPNGTPMYYKGKYYTIVQIQYESNYGWECDWIRLDVSSSLFGTKKISENLNYFNKYFVSLREERKNKLEKLNAI